MDAVPQAGALPALVSLSTLNTKEGTEYAAWAIAKLLILTNPTLLPSGRVMDCIGPLCRLCDVRRGQTTQLGHLCV